MNRQKDPKKIIVRKYGLMRPLNWDKDCTDHLFLQNKFWNRLVEIEREHRAAYRAIVDADTAVADMNQQIEEIKGQIVEQDRLRKEARKVHQAKTGAHTKPFDDHIKELKSQIRELTPQAKELRATARQQAKDALDALEPQRKEAVKAAYQQSGLWWSNYNAVLDSYATARIKAMKTGTELKFHRFDGSGRFRCQVQGGMTTEDLINGRHNIAQLRMIDHDAFAQLLGRKASTQSYGSRNYERGYGVLSITVYTDHDDQGKHRRRMLDFPVILHRPLPSDALLKEVIVTRNRISTDFRWDVVLTFTEPDDISVHPFPEKRCGINLGWKQVEGGLRVATIFDGANKPRHIVLPQVIIDKFAYVEELRGRIDTSTNENFAWLLSQVDDQAPEPLAEAFASLRRAKRPHPAKFARAILIWKDFPEYLPEVYDEAERRRQECRRVEQEHHHLRDKVVRRREDFYRCRAKEIAEGYGLIALDQMDLRQLAVLESADGSPTELHKIARHHRTLASVSTLREWIVKQSKKTGAEVNNIAMKSSSICHKCGELAKAGSGIVRSCLACGSSWDEDENAAINLHNALG